MPSPFIRMPGADGQVRWREEERPVWISRPLAWAKERALTAMIVPHLAYWVERETFDLRAPETRAVIQAAWIR